MESVIFDSEKGRQVCTRLTICEIHRRIYDQVVIALSGHELLVQITKDLETAFTMGVKMNQKLVDHRIKSINVLYPRITDSAEKSSMRQERIRLIEISKDQEELLKATG